MTLIAYLDDATNEVYAAIFRAEEDAAGYFLGLRQVCLNQGIPAAIYADLHTIFQSPAKVTLEQQLASNKPKTQFGRLLDELGIELIAAQSPQAKGRIERLWNTFQDRLVKALRKAGASNQDQANQVLASFLPPFNQRFRVDPAQPTSAFVPWPQAFQPQDFFCFKHTRIVTNDNTFSFDGHRLQIPPGPHRRSYAKAEVDVLQHLDGRLEVRYHELSLASFLPAITTPLRVGKFEPHAIHLPPAPPKTTKPEPILPSNPPTPHKPPAHHPWRHYGFHLNGDPIDTPLPAK
jgi:hypothetical protein